MRLPAAIVVYFSMLLCYRELVYPLQTKQGKTKETKHTCSMCSELLCWHTVGCVFLSQDQAKTVTNYFIISARRS